MRSLIAALFALILACQPVAAETEVDLKLVLLVDASNSIDNAELQFQRRGYGDALTHPDVLNAIRSGLIGRIAVSLMEWADAGNQDVVVPWTIIEDAASATAFRNRLLKARRLTYGSNAIGDAIAAAQRHIDADTTRALRRVIDFSGDSANNWSGEPIAEARARALAAGITINGLAILCLQADCSGRPVSYNLEEAFLSQIIGGPGSFVITVDGRKSFAQAVRRKLILEISDAGPQSARRRHHAGNKTGTRQPVRPHAQVVRYTLDSRPLNGDDCLTGCWPLVNPPYNHVQQP